MIDANDKVLDSGRTETENAPIVSIYWSYFLAYLIFVIFFTEAKFLENKIYTKKKHKLRQNTQKIANFCVITAKYTVNCQFFALLRQNTQ